MKEHEKIKYILTWLNPANISYGYGSQYNQSRIYDDYNEAVADYTSMKADKYYELKFYIAQPAQIILTEEDPTKTKGFTLRR